MNSGLKAIAIAAITVGCLVAVIMDADPLTTLAIGFVGVWVIDDLAQEEWI